MIKSSAPQSTVLSTVLAFAFLAPLAGGAVAQVVGATRLGATTTERRQIATGWSARDGILGQDLLVHLATIRPCASDAVAQHHRRPGGT